ncbi:MAG TPA: DNA-binding response regulator, partial [Leclercia adecarboxylata]|nr:DNA-binding response regulator [Leclercia adecarboxylata]
MDNVIWLIDDDASVRESLVFLLSGMNWRVEPYESIAAFMA